MLEDVLEIGHLERWSAGQKIGSLVSMLLWLFIKMFSTVRTRPALMEGMGKRASSRNQFHPAFWEVVTEQSASDHQVGNSKLSQYKFYRMA